MLFQNERISRYKALYSQRGYYDRMIYLKKSEYILSVDIKIGLALRHI